MLTDACGCLYNHLRTLFFLFAESYSILIYGIFIHKRGNYLFGKYTYGYVPLKTERITIFQRLPGRGIFWKDSLDIPNFKIHHIVMRKIHIIECIGEKLARFTSSFLFSLSLLFSPFLLSSSFVF